MKNPRFFFDKQLLLEHKSKKYILGIDEVGWGCIAGELVLGGSLINKELFDNENYEATHFLESIKDSKKLSEKKRKILLEELKKTNNLIKTAVGVATVDQINSSTNLADAYTICIDQILIIFKDYLDDSLILIDGNRDPKTKLISQFELIVKGDDKSLTIGIASNVAKQYRDDLMSQYDLMYPNYDFINNVGYGTPKHIEGLKNFGLSKIHRIKATSKIMSFK